MAELPTAPRSRAASLTEAPDRHRLGGVAGGTRLLTPEGYRPIETLRRNASVATALGNGRLFVPVAWVGHRQSPADTDPPIRIQRDAIGNSTPRRDLLIAPDHGVYVAGALHRADDLVNGTSIQVEGSLHNVEYWSVRLERHEAIVAENLTIETVPDTTAFIELPGPAAPETRQAPRQAGSLLPHTASLLNVEAEAHAALAGLAQLAETWRVRLEIAVAPDLTLHIAPRTLHEVLDIVLVHAMEATPGGKVLLGAMRHHDRVHIVVVDDGVGRSAELQRADLRRAEQQMALLGGRMDVDSRPGQGTTVLLRLPGPRQGA